MAEIKTKKGEVILVDDEDLDWLSQWSWCVSVYGYARRGYRGEGGKRKTVLMHRAIMGASVAEDKIDHKNGDRLDNRKSNLRICSNSENLRNSKKRVNNTSGFKGVSKRKKDGKFIAQIMRDGKQYYLGLFETAELAHKFYKAAADTLHGDFANHGD